MTTLCPACRSARTRPAFRAAADRDRFLRCGTCGSVFDVEPITPDEMAEIYDGRDYYVKDGAAEAHHHGYSSDYVADRPFIEAKFSSVLGHVERYAGPGRLLDIGCGPGFLLAAARGRGWDAQGIDLNGWAAAFGRDELGVPITVGELGPHSFPGERFDAITMMDLIEHVPSVDDLLDEAARLVRPGGALALLTPDAGAPMSRLLGRRWPEIRGEHKLLFSVAGLAAALARHGFAASGWHSVGKTASVATLAADVAAGVPSVAHRPLDALAATPLGGRVVDLDPHTKFCLYARRLPAGVRTPTHRPARVPKHPEQLAAVDEAILDELRTMADARRLGRWMFDTYAPWVDKARVLEVGAGIGTATKAMLAAGAEHVVAMEPEPSCAAVLCETFADEPRVRVAREGLPDAPSLVDSAASFDLVVCQNVLEHIGDDLAALRAMRRALRPGGRLSLLVPAGSGLFGALDDAYGHWRRYEPEELRELLDAAGFTVVSVKAQNALGIVGWWTKNRRPGARVGALSFRAYEAMVAAWRPLEERLHAEVGLSWVCTAVRPESLADDEARMPDGAVPGATAVGPRQGRRRAERPG